MLIVSYLDTGAIVFVCVLVRCDCEMCVRVQ